MVISKWLSSPRVSLNSVVRASDRCAESSIPCGDSDVLFIFYLGTLFKFKECTQITVLGNFDNLSGLFLHAVKFSGSKAIHCPAFNCP